MRYLITGGAGFIGSHLVDALTMRGDDVLVLDDLSTGRRENLDALDSAGSEDDAEDASWNGASVPAAEARPEKRFQRHGRGSSVEFIEGSSSDEALVDECMASVDACMHLASAVGVQLVVSQPLQSLVRNVRGCDVVISAAARARRKLLFTSTSEVYGKVSDDSLTEDSDRILGSPFQSRWSYATAKSFGESLAHAYHREQGCDMVVARLFNTVGPRQTGAYGMVLPRFVRQAMTGQDLTVYGTGTQARCFTHVLDAVHALVLLSDAGDSVGNAYNVGVFPASLGHRACREGDRAHGFRFEDQAGSVRRGLRAGVRGAGAARPGYLGAARPDRMAPIGNGRRDDRRRDRFRAGRVVERPVHAFGLHAGSTLILLRLRRPC